MTKKIKILIFISIASILAFAFIRQPVKSYEVNFSSNKQLEVGEELTYVVSFSFIKLGEIKIIVRNRKIINGKTYYSTIAYMDSYSGIPFVDLHMIYESTLNPDYYSAFFRGIVKKKEYTTFTEYKFDYDKKIVQIKKGKMQPYQLWTDSTGTADKECEDGLSILYFARIFSGSGKSISLPCFVNEKESNTTINSYTQVTGVSIDAVKYDIACLRIDGEMKFISIFGLTGYFEGWFSDDEASVPIVAKMKVIIGNVRIELKSWKRPGWTPPRYNKS